MTRQNLDQPSEWNATSRRSPRPPVLYASEYGGYAAVMVAFPRRAPTMVVKAAGAKRPNQVSAKAFQPLVSEG